MDINYNALFDLDSEINEPEQKADDVQAPSNQQEIAESAPTDSQSMTEKDTSDTGVEDDSNKNVENTIVSKKSSDVDKDMPIQKKQSADENSKYAAARRKAEAERDEAIRSERQKAKAEIEGFIKSLNLADPDSGKLISTKEEYEAFREKQSISERERLLRRSGLSKEQFEKFIDTLPEIIEARRIKAEAEEVKKEADAVRVKAKIDEQIKQISEMDPSISSMEDLTSMPRYSEFYELVKKGNTFVDAYKLVTYDDRLKKVADVSKKQAAYVENSKNHLTKTGTRGTGAMTVPPEVKEQYKLFNPSATDAEIQAHYSKYHKV